MTQQRWRVVRVTPAQPAPVWEIVGEYPTKEAAWEEVDKLSDGDAATGVRTYYQAMAVGGAA